jgi:hypothetical protein
MINGMLGGSALFLPVAGLAAGWFTSLWTLFLVGFLLYYTAALIITHLGKAINMKYAVLAHFNNNYNYVSAYGIIIWISFIPFIVLQLQMICLEVEAMVGYKSNWITLGVFVLLVGCTIVGRVRHWAEEIMAVGVVGSIIFVVFMTWALITAPSGNNTVPVSGSPFAIIATLVTSLEIHDFLAQNIIKNPRKNEYQSVVKATFLVGGLIYLFTLMGSYGIIFILPQPSSTERQLLASPN